MRVTEFREARMRGCLATQRVGLTGQKKMDVWRKEESQEGTRTEAKIL
jgi:hypothetical protein